MKHLCDRIPMRVPTLLAGVALSVNVMAQSTTVSGHVKDAQGEAIIGATVRIAGQQGGTVTDYDGNFQLKANPGDEITISYVGCEEARVKASSNMVITMQEDAKTLDNVVVIGYGRVKKDDMTGSVTAIKPDELSKGITANASDMLVGKVAGVDVITSGGAPGSGAQIRIRGGSSLNASNDPLYVIDGLVMDNNTATGVSNILSSINPNDIETFTVLKDASATAIYGSRASNGVIIITTKKGKGGQKARVSYNGDVTVSAVAKKYEVLDAAGFKSLVTKLMGDEAAATLGNADTDWQDQIFHVTGSSSHNLSITGGLKNMPYRISVGYQGDNGIIKNSWMRRTNASMNLNPSLLDDHLKFNISAKYTFEKDRYVDAGTVIGAALAMDPTRPVYFDDPTSVNAQHTNGFWQSMTNGSIGSWDVIPNKNATQNPLAYLNENSCIARSNDFSGNFEVDYKIHGFEDLHIHANLGAQYTQAGQEDVNNPTSFSNPYYGYSKHTSYYKYNVVGNAYLEYQKEFGIHNLDIMGGAEQSHYHSNGYNAGYGVDLYTGDKYVETEAIKSQTDWATHHSLVSYFGRLNYTLLGRYMITATMRADGSSRFAEGKKWGYFPSAAFAWKINEEAFMKDLTWWNEFKLRLGWGKTGQQDGIDDFLYTSVYTISNDRAQYALGDKYYHTVRPSASNPDLTWEKTTTYNAGFDFGFLNNRITANVDGYYRKTTDLINDKRMAVMQCFGEQIKRNIGDLENYGVEFTLGFKPVVKKDFTWDVQYNVSWNKNQITSLNGSTDDNYYIFSGSKISRGNNTKIQVNKVGYPVNSFFVYQQVYDEQGKPIEGVYVDRNGDGSITEADRYIYKKPAADVFMGLTSKIIWKRIDFSFALRASFNNYVYYDNLSNYATVCASGIYPNNSFRNTTPANVELGFTGEGGSDNWLSDYFVRNASYLKCTNITLGYSFPGVTTAWGTRTMSGRVFATVQNPFIITKYKGLDPEVSSGVDSSPYPRPISFQLGVNLNF